MVYVPPARRGNPQQSSDDDAPSGEIEDHTIDLETTFADLKLTSPSNNPTALFADIHNRYWAPKSADGTDGSTSPATLPIVLSRSTLNGSALHPDELQYVMLFKDANPRWASDGIVFVKSSLHLLPGYEQAKHADASSVISTGSIVSDKSSAQHSTAPEGETVGDNAMGGHGCSDKQNVLETVDDKLRPRKVEAAKDTGEPAEDIEKQEPGLVDADSNKSPAPLDSHQDDDANNPDFTKPKSDAEVTLPTMPTSYSLNLSQYDTGPIAIFDQVTKRQDGHFRFEGYYKITNLQYLPPQSAELYRMLEQKFSTMDRFGRVKQKARSAASWNASMSLMWAVIKMERDEEANSRLGPPSLTRSRTAEA